MPSLQGRRKRKPAPRQYLEQQLEVYIYNKEPSKTMVELVQTTVRLRFVIIIVYPQEILGNHEKK